MIITSIDSIPTKDQLLEGCCFLIDKPYEWTSFDVVNKLRWVIRKSFGIKKIKVGHAGTLDPLATGLLLVCTGKMTKRISEFMADDKVYTGEIKLGFTTPSFDRETEEEQKKEIKHITENKVIKSMKCFEGELTQTPPIYSAIKQDGKRLYEHARSGQSVDIKTKQIRVDKFELKAYHPPIIHFEILCSKGTYIRSLANDIGEELGCGGYLYNLRRNNSGEYDVMNAWEMEKLLFEIKSFTQDQYQQ